MKMRLVWYAGVSTALAGAVVLSAFHQRANFYSAMVHLAQSSLSLMIIVNLVFLVYGTIMYGLQRLLFGPLRPVEIEQLYEKAWFAVTETCLAMTIFREEIGAFFLVMFTALVTGKVWGWIGEGRVEVLEQQPPNNPWLFHGRLCLSLLISVVYDLWLLRYAVLTVVQQARPTMMVMFLFEFAVLAVCSFQTATRYVVSLVDQHVVRTQTRQRLADRRRQIREQRADILRRREEEGGGEEGGEPLPSEDDVDELDIEVPGWQTKGQWVLVLDLIADFIKLGIYSAFFTILFRFYGLPIHILRDLFMTVRSFFKRLRALLRYRQALKDMDQYPDATAEELAREDTCIICRDEMRPWDADDATRIDRSRPKKLPCGHILHFGCLKSWLERQQVCPTCRRQVVQEGAAAGRRNGDAFAFRLMGQNQNQAPADGQVDGAGQANAPRNNRNGVRMFNLGPFRLGFAQGGAQELQEMANQLVLAGNGRQPPAATPTPTRQGENGNTVDQIRTQIEDIRRRINVEMHTLANMDREVGLLNLALAEAENLRRLQPQRPAVANPTAPTELGPTPNPTANPTANPIAPTPTTLAGHGHVQNFVPQIQAGPGPIPLPLMQPYGPFPPRGASITRHGPAANGTAIPAGSPDMPEGLVLPPGWSLLPLQRMDGAPAELAANAPPNMPVLDQQPATRPSRSPNPSTAATRGSGASDRSVSVGREVRRDASTPPVTAPTPLMPNWGGSNQLFGAGSGLAAWQPGTASASAAPEAPLAGSSSQGAAETAVTAEADADANAIDAGTNGSAEPKGKGKAVTVEEAGDDENAS